MKVSKLDVAGNHIVKDMLQKCSIRGNNVSLQSTRMLIQIMDTEEPRKGICKIPG